MVAISTQPHFCFCDRQEYRIRFEKLKQAFPAPSQSKQPSSSGPSEVVPPTLDVNEDNIIDEKRSTLESDVRGDRVEGKKSNSTTAAATTKEESRREEGQSKDKDKAGGGDDDVTRAMMADSTRRQEQLERTVRALLTKLEQVSDTVMAVITFEWASAA